MARGWESKSVESQQESAKTKAASPSRPEGAKGANDGARERQGLLLSRAYVLHQIESSTNVHYTASLRKALEDLDRKLAQLGDH
jgi:hypothetical protein